MPDGVPVTAVTGLIPMETCHVDADNFCADASLDGLMVETVASHVLGAGAFERLQYVCAGLQRLQGGRFPRKFPERDVISNALSGKECFRTLRSYLPADVTVKAGWAFTNAMFWQLQAR